jgi:hypothetical protein
MNSSFDSKRTPSRNSIFSLLTLVILIVVFIALIIVLSIFANPHSPLNPFPPPSLPPIVKIPTPTATQRSLPGIWTPTPGEISGIGEPNLPLDTPPLAGTSLPFSTPIGGFSFGLQGSPTAVSSASFRTDPTCSWMGVGGRVYSLSNSPMKGFVLRLGGSINGVELGEQFRLSGLDTIYGPSGFEFTLSGTPLQTVESYWIQLQDQAGNPLTDKIYFDTYADCKRNLILINFKQLF